MSKFIHFYSVFTVDQLSFECMAASASFLLSWTPEIVGQYGPLCLIRGY